MESIYNFSVKKVNGEEQSLKEYEGSPMIIVNTASKCGFTPQFKQLQELYDVYKEQGLVILGFPCSQFNNQEFEQMEETMEFCQLNYGVTFPMFAKVDVKGDNIDPLFQFLVQQKKGILTDGIKWNFTKFLVDRKGNVIQRYAPQTSPRKIEEDLLKIL